MAAWEHQLISRIIRTGELNNVVEWGITHQDFTTAEGLAMYGRMIEYHALPATAGAVWGPMSLHQLYPNYVISDDPSMTTGDKHREARRFDRAMRDRDGMKTEPRVAAV